MVLALLYLTTYEERFGVRAWKGHDWAAMDRLFEKGYIHDPGGPVISAAARSRMR